MNLETPRTLPVNLSHSSLEMFFKCQIKWRNKYIERLYEPAAGIQILGRAVHQAEAQSYHHQVDSGEPNSLEEVLDDFSTSLENERETEPYIDWGDAEPDAIKDRGVRLLKAYHSTIPYAMKPRKVESRFEIKLHPENEWHVSGFVDVIGSYDDGFIQIADAAHDLKTVRRAITQDDLDSSTQGTLYSYATMLDNENERPFIVHEIKETAKGASARIVESMRTKIQGDLYMQRVASAARQIDANLTSGDWQGAPQSAWWCRRTSCGFWPTCPAGGLS